MGLLVIFGISVSFAGCCCFSFFGSGLPSQSSLRDASSPKGGALGEEAEPYGMRKPLPLGEVAPKVTERARMLPEIHRHSDSIALTKNLLIAAQRL